MTVLNPTVLPLNDHIAESEWSLYEPVGKFVPQFAPAPTDIVRYSTARWRVRLKFESLSQADRHLLNRFVAAAGTVRSFWMWEPSLNIRGSFATSELLTAPDTGSFWTGGTGRSIVTDSGGVRVTRTSTDSSTVGTTSALTVVSGAKYALRALWEPGAGATHSLGMTCGSTRTGTGYGSLAASAVAGRRVLVCSPSAASMYVGFTDTVTTSANWAEQGFYLLRGASVVRAFQIDGGSGALTQVGSRAYVKNLTTGGTALMKAGDMVEIVSAGFAQMVRLTEDISSDSTGKTVMCFEPQLRSTVSADDLVIPYRPMVKMQLMVEPKIPTRSGWYSTVELECEEAL